MQALPHGFEVPVHRALTEPIMLGGSPRALAIINGTLASAVGIGLRLWILGILLGVIGHGLAIWVGRRDPQFLEVARRHVRYPAVLIP
jgi:type IV secretion system protein TrbD